MKRLIITLIFMLLFVKASAEVTQNFKTTFDTTQFENGWHMLCAVARDEQNNTQETCVRVKILNKGKK